MGYTKRNVRYPSLQYDDDGWVVTCEGDDKVLAFFLTETLADVFIAGMEARDRGHAIDAQIDAQIERLDRWIKTLDALIVEVRNDADLLQSHDLYQVEDRLGEARWSLRKLRSELGGPPAKIIRAATLSLASERLAKRVDT